jgi:hypothetical protein
MEPTLNTHIAHILTRIDTCIATNQALDLKDVFAYYSYDITSHLTFNAEFDHQQHANPDDLPPLNDHFMLSMLYGFVWNLMPHIATLTSWLPYVQRLKAGRVKLAQMSRNHVQNALAVHEKNAEAKTLLTNLIEAHDPETGEKLGVDAINTEAFGLL